MRTFSPDSPLLYTLVSLVVLYALAQSVFFMVKALLQVRAPHIKRKALKRAVFSLALFSVTPTLCFLIGVLSLSAFLGVLFADVRKAACRVAACGCGAGIGCADGHPWAID